MPKGPQGQKRARAATGAESGEAEPGPPQKKSCPPLRIAKRTTSQHHVQMPYGEIEGVDYQELQRLKFLLEKQCGCEGQWRAAPVGYDEDRPNRVAANVVNLRKQCGIPGLTPADDNKAPPLVCGGYGGQVIL